MSAAKKIVDRKILRELVPLNTLSKARFEEISGKIIIEEVRAGSHLFRINDRDNQTVYLLGGEIDLLDGKRKPSVTIKAESDKSRYPLADAQPRVMSARAAKKSVVARIDSSLLDAFLSWDQSNNAEAVSIGADENEDWMTRMLQSRAFENIPPAMIQRLLLRMESVHYKAGATVISQGDAGDYFYTIKIGRCAVTRRDTSQAEDLLLAELSDGDCFGEESLVLDVERNATVSMLTDGVLMRLAKDDFVELLQKPLVRYVNYEKAANMVDEGAVWVDVRTAGEYESSALEDSVNIPLSSVRGEMPDLVFNVVYVICCDTDQLSASAAFILRHKGFDVYVLKGGLQAVPEDVFSYTPDSSEADPEVAASISEFEQQPTAQQDQKQQLESDLASAHEQQALLQGQVDELKRLEQSAAELQEQKQQLESDLASAHEQQALLQGQVDELKRLEQSAAELQEQKQQLESDLASAHEQQVLLQGRLDKMKQLAQTTVELQEQKQLLESKLAGAHERQVSLERQMGELKSLYEQDKQQLEMGADVLERSAAASQDEAGRLEIQVSEQAEKIDGLLADKQAVTELLDRHTQEWDEERALLRSGHEAVQQQLAELETQLELAREESVGDKAGLQEDLEAVRKERDSIQQELGAAMDAAAGQQQKIDGLKAQVASVAGSADEQVQSLEALLEAGRQQLEELEQQAADRLAQQNALQDELAGMKEAESRLEQEAVALQQQKEALQQALEERDEQERARQQEHEQLLAQAHDDLARKNEIEQELQGQLEQLNRELEQTSSELQEQKQQLEADLSSAGEQQALLEGQLAELKQQHEQDRQRLEMDADERLQALEAQLEAGRQQLEELEQQAADRLAQQNALQDELAGMKEAESRLEQEAVALQQQKEALQQALEERDEQERARQQEHEQLLAQAHDDLARKNEIEQELQGQLEQLNRELEQTSSELQEQKQQLEADLSSAGEQQALLEGQLAELKQQHEQDRQRLEMDADERLQALEAQLEAGRQQLEELEQQAADRLAQQNALQDELAGMKEAESRLEQEAVALQQQKDELQQALEERDEQERARQQEHEQLLAQAHDDLARKNEIEQELQGQLEQLNRELEQTSSELQEQKQQLEADLSSAGERQALLEGQLAELKQQHEQDRQQLESNADEHERSVTALQGEARQLEVRIREQAEKIDNLQTDKQAAAEALDRQIQEWDGERALFMSGDEELQQQLAELEGQLEQTRERAAGDRAELQAELDELTSKTSRKIEDREAQCVELEQGHSRLLGELEVVRKERDSFQQELGAAMDAAAGQQQKIESLKTQVASVAGSADEHVQSLEIQLQDGRIQLEDLERQVADRLAQQNAMQEEMAGMKATESRLEQEKEELQQALQQRDEQEKTRELEHEQLLAQAHDSLTGKNEIERELQGQVDRLRKKLEQTTSELQDVREVAQSDVDSIREELHKERSARSAERAEMAARQRELKEQLMSVATEHEENITNQSGAIEQAQITAREEEQARVQQLHEMQLEAEEHLEKLQSELNQAHEEIAALVEREKTRRNEEHDLTEDLKEQSESTLNQLRTQAEQLVQERDAALKEQRALREKVNSLRAEVEVSRGLMGGGPGQVEDPLKLRHELDEARKNVEIAVRLRAAAEATCASLKEERDALQKQVGNTLDLGKPLNVPLLDQDPKQADRPDFSAKPVKNQPAAPAAGKHSQESSGSFTGGWGRLAKVTGLAVILFAGILYGLKTYVDLPVAAVTPGQDDGEVLTGTSPASNEGVDSELAAGSQALVPGQETAPEPRVRAAQAIEPPEPVADAAILPQRPAAMGSFRERLRGGGVAPLMVKLPAADFMMGSQGKSLNRDEGPQHKVSLSRFAISKHEVTFADYDRFARATGARLPHDETWGRGDHPVINVSWKDARAYVKWLSAQTGHTYRLPTEAEWEFAARAGGTALFPWEFGTDGVQANCFDCGSKWDKSRTAPVGSFSGNHFGLHDMGGNVQEWTEDCYRAGYDGAPADGSAVSISDCTQRAVRGGGYTSPGSSLRIARRGQYDQDTRLDNLGFRIVRNY